MIGEPGVLHPPTVGPDALEPPAQAAKPPIPVPELILPPARARRVQPMTVVRVAVTAGAFVLIARKIGVGSVLHELAHADAGWLAGGYAVAVVTILITVAQWHGLANANGVPCTYGRCLHLELGGDVFDAALPSSIGGDVVRAASLADRPDQRVPAAASVVLRRLCNFPGMILLTVIGVLATIGDNYAEHVRLFALVVVAGGFALLLLAMSPALGRLSQVGVLRRGPGPAVAKLLATLHEFRGQRRDLVWASLRGIVFWITVVISQSMFMVAVGIHVTPAYAALVITTATAVTMVPISLGGYGLREGAFAAFLTAGGHATAAQGAAVGVCITVQMLALGVIGIPFYLTIRTRRAAVWHSRRPSPNARSGLPDAGPDGLPASGLLTSGYADQRLQPLSGAQCPGSRGGPGDLSGGRGPVGRRAPLPASASARGPLRRGGAVVGEGGAQRRGHRAVAARGRRGAWPLRRRAYP